MEHVADEGGWNDRGARDPHAQRPERVRSLLGPLDQRVKQGRWPLHHRDPVFGHDPLEACGIEGGHRNRRGARHQARQQAGLVPADVRERAHHRVAVPLGQPDHLGPARRGLHHGAVTEHGALRRTGGARGVLHMTHVARRERGHPAGRARRSTSPRRRTPPTTPGPAVVAPSDTTVTGPGMAAASVAGLRSPSSPAASTTRQPARAHQGGRLHRGVARVDRDDRAAGAQHGERGHGPLRRVGCPESDAVAGADPGLDQGGGGRPHQLQELLVGDGPGPGLVHQRRAPGVGGGGAFDHAGNGPRRSQWPAHTHDPPS